MVRIEHDEHTYIDCYAITRARNHLAEFLSVIEKNGGAERDRTDDLYNAIVALSQLSYGPTYLFTL